MLRREQVKEENVVVEAQRRRDEALAKCMAAEVSDLPLPRPVLPGMDIDGTEGVTKSKAKKKRHHKFLLPEPKQTEEADEEMVDATGSVKPAGSAMCDSMSHPSMRRCQNRYHYDRAEPDYTGDFTSGLMPGGNVVDGGITYLALFAQTA